MKSKEEKLSTDAPMTAADEAGLACLLTDAEIRKRRAAIQAEFKQGVKAVKELPDGYELQFPGDPQWIRVLSAFIEYESHCCPFLTFSLKVSEKSGPIYLQLTGSQDAKRLLKAELNA
ncbi:MAG: hypothetical protein IIA14_13305 [SAR324 cluster bacterium]|nr:hypothetical protein [SAR324 cluster bacterium]